MHSTNRHNPENPIECDRRTLFILESFPPVYPFN